MLIFLFMSLRLINIDSQKKVYRTVLNRRSNAGKLSRKNSSKRASLFCKPPLFPLLFENASYLSFFWKSFPPFLFEKLFKIFTGAVFNSFQKGRVKTHKINIPSSLSSWKKGARNPNHHIFSEHCLGLKSSQLMFSLSLWARKALERKLIWQTPRRSF